MTDSKAAEKPQETAPATAPPPVEPVPSPPRWLTWAGRRPFALLALLGLLLWLPGVLSLPALDRDESRFAQSSHQMVESGNWWTSASARCPATRSRWASTGCRPGPR